MYKAWGKADRGVGRDGSPILMQLMAEWGHGREEEAVLRGGACDSGGPMATAATVSGVRFGSKIPLLPRPL